MDVIGQVVSLKRAGGNYKGLCPFHNEKTPSFVVSDTKQIFSCFGCNAAGDVLGFVEKYYNLDFPGAIEKLAADNGIEIEETHYKSSNKEELYEINREAARFFYKNFWNNNNPAFEYMSKRGINHDVLKKFGIGYADGEWKSLVEHFVSLGTDIKLLISLGLVAESKGSQYDKFRDRVIFPIINAAGKVIGFGGRAIAGGEPKYLNSPESSIFLKKNNLFGLNLTRQEISKENCGILVEGYMDVISLYQGGIRNVAASLGTALTASQAKLLKRLTQNAVLAYDADEAGKMAALRGGEILYNEGLKAKIIKIPSGKDPDDYITEHGKLKFLELAGKAVHYVSYKIEQIKANHEISETDGRLEFIKEAVSFLRSLSPATAEAYIKIIAKETGISESAIMMEYNNKKGKTLERPVVRESLQDSNQAQKLPDELERNLIKLAISSKGYFDKIERLKDVFNSKCGYEIYIAIKENYSNEKEFDIRKLIDSLDESCVKIFEDILENVLFSGKEEQAFEGCVKSIEINDLTRRYDEIAIKLSMADEVENAQQIEALTMELIEVQREMQEKKGRSN